MNLSEEAEHIAVWLGRVAGGVAVIFSCFRWGFPAFRNAYTAYLAASDLSSSFGSRAGEVIRKTIVELQTNKGLNAASIDALALAVGLGIYTCDRNGKCITVNTVLERLMGMSSSEMKDFGWLSAIENKQLAHRNWMFSVENDTPYRDEYVITNMVTSERFECRSEALRVRVGTEELYVGFVQKKKP